MFQQVYILDVTNTEGNIRKAIDEYAKYHDTFNGCYYGFDVYDLMEHEHNEDNPDAKKGWQELQALCRKQNIFKFYVHYWW